MDIFLATLQNCFLFSSNVTDSLIDYFRAVPSGPPSSVTVPSKTHSSITMIISPPALQDRNGEITSYLVRLTRVSNGAVRTFTTSQVGQPFTATGLLPYTTYSLTVAARTVNGTGPSTSSFSVTTAETGNGGTPKCGHTEMEPRHTEIEPLNVDTLRWNPDTLKWNP